MTAQEELKIALRTFVGPWLRSRGFKGSGTTWRMKSDRGDFAIVNFQSSQFSTTDELSFAVNMAVAPEPWLEWDAFRSLPGIGPKYLLRQDPTKPRAEGVWTQRLHPGGNDLDNQWWRISDSTSATAAAEDVILQLELVGLPQMVGLMDRESIIELVRGPDTRGQHFNRAMTLAILLSDQGASPELDHALAAVENDTNVSADVRAELFRWSRKRVAERTSR